MDARNSLAHRAGCYDGFLGRGARLNAPVTQRGHRFRARVVRFLAWKVSAKERALATASCIQDKVVSPHITYDVVSDV